jgi:hypothetical protein
MRPIKRVKSEMNVFAAGTLFLKASSTWRRRATFRLNKQEQKTTEET